MNLIYIYLDPRQQCKYRIDLLNIVLNNVPIYVGRSNNKKRKFSHIECASKGYDGTNNPIKLKILSKILKETSLEDYKNNFILEFEVNESEYLEYLLIEDIGRICKNTGPLTNISDGGSNPVLCGNMNPMFNKSLKDVWTKKYGEEEASILERDRRTKISNSLHKRWNEITDEDRKKIIEKCKKSSYWKKLSVEEKKILLKNRKKRPGLYVLWFNKYGKTEADCRLANFKEKLSDAIKKSMTFEVRQKISKQVKASFTEEKRLESSKNSKLYWDNLKEDAALYEKVIKKKKEYFVKLKENKEAYLEFLRKRKDRNFLNTMSIQDKQEWLNNNRKGKNNPMSGQGHKLTGNKNGRAKIILIEFPNGQKFFCNGTFKKFSKDLLSKIKPQPHRKSIEWQIENGWIFKEVSNIDKINKKKYIEYV